MSDESKDKKVDIRELQLCDTLCQIGISGKLQDGTFITGSQFLDPSSLKITSTNVPVISANYSFINSISDYSKILGISGKITVSAAMGLAKLSGAGSYLKQSMDNTKQIEVIARCTVLTSCDSLDNMKIKRSSSATLSYVGPYYIKSIWYGAAMTIRMRFTFVNSQTKEKIAAKLSGSVDVGVASMDGEATFNRDMDELNNNSQVSVDAILEGVNWKDVFDSKESVITAITDDLKAIPRFMDLFLEYGKKLKKMNNGEDKKICYPFRCQVAPIASAIIDSNVTSDDVKEKIFKFNLDDYANCYLRLSSFYDEIETLLLNLYTTLQDDALQTWLSLQDDIITRLSKMKKFVIDPTDDDGSDLLQECNEFYQRKRRTLPSYQPILESRDVIKIESGSIVTDTDSRDEKAWDYPVSFKARFGARPRLSLALVAFPEHGCFNSPLEPVISQFNRGGFHIRTPVETTFCAYHYLAL